MRGNQTEKPVNKDNLCLLNQKVPTHINSTIGSLRTIDLATSWSVFDNIYGSDLYPIILRNDKEISDHLLK